VETTQNIYALFEKGIGQTWLESKFHWLKQKERDEMELVFKSWKVDEPFNVVELRDHRLRGYYGDRYDW